MLKKIKYIVVSILLIISTMGVAITKHYCIDELVSISILKSAESCCNEPDADCCHNEDEFFILKVDFCGPTVVINNISEVTLFVIENSEVVQHTVGNNVENNLEIDLKPPLEVHVFLAKNQSYLL